MQNNEFTTKKYFAGLNILHLALLAGPTFIAALSLYFKYAEGGLISYDPFLNNILIVVVPLLVIGETGAAIFISRNRLSELQEEPELADMLNGYRGLYILRFALFEGGALLAVICHLLTANNIFLIIAVVPYAMLLLDRPNPEQLADDLELSVEDEYKIKNPDTIIS